MDRSRLSLSRAATAGTVRVDQNRNGESPSTTGGRRFYQLTRKGRAKLVAETSRSERVVRAVSGVLQAPEKEEA